MSIKSFLQTNHKAISGMGLLGAVPLIFSPLLTALMIRHEPFLQNLTPVQWLPLFGLSALTMALAMTPSTVVALVSGFFLGWASTPFMLMAYLLASALGYLIGRWLDRGRLMPALKEHPRVHTVLSGLHHQEWSLMILTRLSPVLPFALMNLLLAAVKVRFRVFLVGGFFGMLPRTLFSIWAGMQARGLMQLLQNPDQGTAASIIVIVLTLVSVGGLLLVFQKLAIKQLHSS
ncbi:MAG: TVP38/TMEM64 family protein [Endozoicomonas sp.]